MDRKERRERIAGELFVNAMREEHLLRIDRGPDGRGEELDFRESMVEAIAGACVHAADKLIRALDQDAKDSGGSQTD